MVLAEDVLYSLCQGEGLAGTIGPNDKNGGQRDRDGCGDGQDGLFLFGIQTRIQLLIPLPEGGKRMEAFFDDQINCYYKHFKLKHSSKILHYKQRLLLNIKRQYARVIILSMSH